MQKKSLCADDLQSQKVKVIETYSPMVYRLAFSLIKSSSDAEDIHQEVFVRYLLNSPEFESEEHRKAWFIRVTTNLCKNWWKTAWKRKVVSFTELAGEEGSCGAEQGKYSKTTAAVTEEKNYLITAVQKLPVKYRAVIHLFYYEELSIEEIAGILARKPSTVRTQLTRARRKLKEMLKEDV